MDNVEGITRQQLYEQVWTEPVSKVAPRYGISNVALSKICRKYKVPIPPRGYWAKIHAGGKPKKIPLLAFPQFDNHPLPLRLSHRVDPLNQKKLEHPKTALERIGEIKVPDQLNLPHPLVRAAAKRLKQKTGWSNVKGLRCAPEEVLHIEVTRQALDRALLIADTLVKTFEAHGGKVRVDSNGARSYLDVNAVSLELAITERIRRTKHELTQAEQHSIERWQKSARPWDMEYPRTPDFDYHPTGELIISVGRFPSRTWRDTSKTPLEKRLHLVIAGSLDLAEERRLRAEEQARKQMERERAKARYDFLIAQRKKEQEQLDCLKTETARWHEAESLRRYISAVEQAAHSGEGLSNELQVWITWAKLKADCIDPLVPVCDVILDAPEPESPGYFFSR